MSWLISRALMEDYENSLYLPGLVAEFSAATCLDGEQSVPSKSTDTPQAYSWPDKMTDASHRSRSGMMFEHLTGNRGAELLTWYLGASLARTSALRETETASTVCVPACGANLPGSFVTFDRHTSSWKTRQLSLLAGLDVFSGTWPRWGSMRNGACLERKTQALGTNANASGLLPTLTVHGNYNRKGASANSGDGLATALRRFPTLCARDWRSGKASAATMERNASPLSEVIGGTLNPTWCEWFMGWPIGFTALDALETDKFRQWRRSHGKR
jgi:hypothetical protein